MEGVSEWSERMDIAGSNHWLPAYGLQQPNQLQQVLLQQHQEGTELIGNDGGTVLIAGQQQQFLFLETIVEETSDDLRSESDRSGPAGWPDSDSDTESVIHVPSNLEERADWSGSERDLAVPKKRRRRHGGTNDSNDEETTSLSRSSSLLQFECLEKHCEDVFRTTDPFPPPSPASAISSFSFDSLESNRWRFSASPDSLDEDRCDSTGPSSTSSSGDEGASSDDTLQHSSWSSSRGSSFRSSGGSRLRSFRSFDSLNLLQQNNSSHHSLAELSQSLNSTFLLQHPRADLSQADAPAEINQKNSSSSQESSNSDSTATVKDADGSKTSDGKSEATAAKKNVVEAKQQRSAENLSEDSGFGDHCCIPSSSSNTVTVGTIVEDEDGDNDNDSCTSSYYSDCSAGGSSGGAAGSSETSETERKGTPKRKVLKLVRESEKRGWETDESKFNGSCWQSAPSLLTREGKAVRSKFGSGQDQLSSVPHDLNLAGEHDDEDDEDTFERYSDAHSSPAVASPEKVRIDEEDVSEDPTQESQYKMASRLPVASTPNLTYTGQDDFLRHELRHSSMTQVPLNDGMSEENHRPISKSLMPLPTKGVHFSPVVSEVSWRDSYSDDGGEAVSEKKEEKEDTDEEEMEKALLSLEKGEDVAVRVQKTPMPLTLQKLQIGLPVGPEERERYVMELNDNDLLTLQPPAPPVTPTSHVVHSTATSSSNTTTVSAAPMEAKQESNERRDSDLSSSSSGKKSGKFGSFFQRFSLRRLSGRVVGGSSKNKQKEEKKKSNAKKPSSNANLTTATAAVYEDVTIIPLHPPTPETKPAPPDVVVVSSKPPLPPLPPRGGGVVASANKTTPSTRRRPESPSLPARAQCDATSGGNNGLSPGQLNMSVIDPARRPPPLETDLDSVVRRQNGATTVTSKKARSLVNLGDAGNQKNVRAGHGTEDAMLLKPPNSAGPAMTSSSNGGHRPLQYGVPTDARAKSMEFLLDKENQAAVQPPENELQKGSGAAGERVMSEHQLRVQRSLQKLNVPDWYKNSSVARGPEGFLLKRGSDSGQGARDGWPGLGSKTTSLSSLGSTQSAATARSPTSHLLSPSPTPHVFTRWSTSRLNSGGTSASTSPCGSTRSSFNYRQPYLGWRSQERLSRPRTPAERLAAGLLPATSPQQAPQQQMLSSPLDHKQIMKHEEELAQLQREREIDDEMMQQVPNLSEVRTSIKEVTSAIVHYVSGVGGAGASQWDSLSPPVSGTTPRSGSPRGSSGRLCWLESSFVGSRPLDSPETPLTLPSGDVNKTLESLQQQQQKQQQEATKVAHAVPDNLYLELNTVPQHQVNGPEEGREEELHNKPSPGSTTLEDVLDSLLGLPPTSRSPSPAPATASPCRPPPPTPPRSTHHGHHHHHHRHHHHHHHNQRRSCGDLAGSASDGDQPPATPPQQQPPPYYVSDTLRRRSEGSAQYQQHQQQQQTVSGGGRRVSFDMSQQQPQGGQQHQAQQEESAVVRCRYSKCGKTASVAEARRTFKTCHNCSHVYCSRECRRAHWEKHRKTCLHSRVGALCRQVLATAREDPATLRHLSLLARRGYLAQGRGAVKSFFSSPELAERFVANGFPDLGEPAFVRWADLLPGEMGADLYSELLRLCKSYNPDTRFVLYVAVCVVSEVPTTGAVKWERQLVSRCAKLRLCRSLQHQGGTPTPATAPATPQRRGPSPCNITRDSENPETLILTSLPGCQGQMSPQRAREISFTNIQRHLRQRGVSLRRHFPDVYKRLLAYVEGSTERFTPVTVYPRDAVTGKSFMCIIMPDAEPEKLELVPRDSSRVQTIDISLEHDPA